MPWDWQLSPMCGLTNRNYRWNDFVVVYHDVGDVPSDKELESVRSASILLQLGLSVAQADDDISEGELTHITEQLDRQFEFGERQLKRLKALEHLLMTRRSADMSIARTLQKTLSVSDRRLEGRYLVMIAEADKVICHAERDVLERAYRGLGIPAKELEKYLAEFDAKTAASSSSCGNDTEGFDTLPALDLERIRAIREETSRVQELLHEVLTRGIKKQMQACCRKWQISCRRRQLFAIHVLPDAHSGAASARSLLAVAKFATSTSAV